MSRIPRREALPPWGTQEPSALKTELLTKQGHGEAPSRPRKAAVRREALTGALPPYHDRESAAAFLKGLREPMDLGDLGHGELPWSGGGLDATLGGRQSQPTGPWDPWGWLESQWGKYGPTEMDRLFGGPPEGDGVGMCRRVEQCKSPAEVEARRKARIIKNAVKALLGGTARRIGAKSGHPLPDSAFGIKTEHKKPPKKSWLDRLRERHGTESEKKASGRHIELIKWANREAGRGALADLWRKIRTGALEPEQLDMPTRMALSQALSGVTFAPLGARAPDTGYARVFEVQKKGMEGRWKAPPDKVQMLFAWGNIDPRPE